MKTELANYKISQQVYRLNESSLIKITPRGAHAKFDFEKNYVLQIFPMEQSMEASLNANYALNEYNIDKDGSLSFSYIFEKEQQYNIKVSEQNQKTALTFSVYAVLDDLYQRRVLKGDLHVHSYYSDGKEEPAVVAANYRKHGFDFLAITDHERYYPSQEAIERFKDLKSNLHLFNGEEVHVFGGYIHAINFGGNFSVNEYYKENEEQANKCAKELAKTSPFDEEIEKIDYGRRAWIAKEIKRGEGLAVLVHPYWAPNTYNMREDMTKALLKNEIYDAFELLGGQTPLENNHQLAQYFDMRASGINVNVVGSSDSHGTEPPVYFTQEFTLVFSKDSSLKSIISAIKNGYSVAVENYNNSYTQSYGNLRMVKFANFLLSEYFPEYEELCFEQGRALKSHLIGEEDQSELLNLLYNRTLNFYNRFYGKKQ